MTKNGVRKLIVMLWALPCGGRCIVRALRRRLQIIVVMTSMCLVWGVSPGQAQSQTCPDLGRTIRTEWKSEDALYIPTNPEQTPVSRGMVQRLFWDNDTGCILVQSSMGLWLYPNSALDAPPTLIQTPTTRSDTPLFMRSHPDGSLGVSVRLFAYSPDGRLIARLGYSPHASADVIELVERDTGRILSTADITNFTITHLEFNADQSLILGATNDGRVVGWSIDNLSKELFILGESIQSYHNESAIVQRSAAHRMTLQGDRLIVGHGNGVIHVWDLATRTLIHTLQGHVGAITDLAFDGTGHVISASLDGSIRLWDTATGQSLGVLSPLLDHAPPILDIVVNAKGTHILSADSLGTLRLRALAFTPSDVLATVPTPLRDVSLNAAATLIAAAGEDGLIRLFDETGRLQRTLRGHDGTVNTVALSRDGQTVISGGHDATTRRWNLSDSTSTQVSEDPVWPVRDVAFMPNDQEWMSVGWDKIPRSHSRDSIYGSAWVSDEDYIESLAISPDFTLFATGNWRGEIRVWPFGNSSIYSQPIRLISNANNPSRINALAFHPNGRLLAAASQSGSLSIWDVSTPSIVLLGTMMVDANGINDLAFTPDGRSLIGVSSDVFIWNTTTWLETGFRRGGGSPITALAMSAEGDHVLTVDEAGVIRRIGLDAPPKEPSASHFGPVIDATAFDDSGTLIAVSRTEMGVWIWTPNGERAGILLRQTTNPHEPLTLSPNAEYVISKTTGYTTKTTTGLTAPRWFATHEISLDYLGGFSADSRVLASLLGSITLWDMDTGRRAFQMDMIDQRPVFFTFVPGRKAFLVQTDAMIMQMRRTDAPNEVLHQYACDAFPQGCLSVMAVSRDYFMTSDHRIYSLEDGHEVMTLRLDPAPPSGIVFDSTSPQPLIVNQGLQIGSSSNVLTVFDASTLEIVILDMRSKRQQRVPRRTVTSVIVNPAGDTLYGLTYDGSLLMWPIGDPQ